MNANNQEKPAMKVICGMNQMSLIRDTEEVIKFLEFVGRKSILEEQAIHCRLTACNNLFSVINEEEDSVEYILNNLDVLINRFRNKNNNVRASTLKVYKSRAKSSLEDYKAWSADPFLWERSITDKKKAQTLEGRKRQKRETPLKTESEVKDSQSIQPSTSPSPTDREHRKISLPIRPDFSVDVILPVNGLTKKEWTRLGMFLYPYCQDIEVEKSGWLSNLN